MNQLITSLAIGDDTMEVTYLLQFSPAGFERYFHKMSEPARCGCAFTDLTPTPP